MHETGLRRTVFWLIVGRAVISTALLGSATFMQVTGDRYRWEFQLQDGEQEADLITSRALGALLQPWTGRATLDGLEIALWEVFEMPGPDAEASNAPRPDT